MLTSVHAVFFIPVPIRPWLLPRSWAVKSMLTYACFVSLIERSSVCVRARRWASLFVHRGRVAGGAECGWSPPVGQPKARTEDVPRVDTVQVSTTEVGRINRQGAVTPRGGNAVGTLLKLAYSRKRLLIWVHPTLVCVCTFVLACHSVFVFPYIFIWNDSDFRSPEMFDIIRWM